MKVEMLMPQMGESIAEATIAKWRKHERKKFNQDRASKSGIYPAHSLTSFLIQESAELAPEFVIEQGQNKNCQYDEFGF
ncbi:MAG: hypothetical protein RLZZ260_617 [Actinomycetota bacterium]